MKLSKCIKHFDSKCVKIDAICANFIFTDNISHSQKIKRYKSTIPLIDFKIYPGPWCAPFVTKHVLEFILAFRNVLYKPVIDPTNERKGHHVKTCIACVGICISYGLETITSENELCVEIYAEISEAAMRNM